MTSTKAYQVVKKFIDDERKMREFVFRHAEEKRKVKVQEADDALAALELLLPARPVAGTQVGLFERDM